MQHLVQFALRHMYYHGLAVGVVNFEYDFGAGMARVTRRASVYAILANVAMASIFPVLYYIDLNMTLRLEHLQYFIFTILTIIRLTCVLLTFSGNWFNRAEFIALLRDFHRLHRRYFGRLLSRYPAALRTMQVQFLTKYLLATTTEVMMFTFSMRESGLPLSPRVYFGLMLVSLLTSTMSFVFTYGVFAIMLVNLHYDLLQCELAEMLGEAQHRHPGIGVCEAQCCRLADRVNAWARAERQLHDLCDRMTQMHALQTCCVALTIYVTCVASIFFTYTLFTNSNHFVVGLHVRSAAFIAAIWFVFLKDMQVSFFAFFRLLDLRQDCGELLRAYLQLPTLDVRLEKSLQNVILQLQGRSIVLSALGLFDFNKLFFFSMFGSLVQHSIVLIQYNIKISL